MQGLQEAYFKINKYPNKSINKNSGEQEKGIHYSYEGRIEKIVPRDNRLSSLGKPRDA